MGADFRTESEILAGGAVVKTPERVFWSSLGTMETVLVRMGADETVRPELLRPALDFSVAGPLVAGMAVT